MYIFINYFFDKLGQLNCVILEENQFSVGNKFTNSCKLLTFPTKFLKSESGLLLGLMIKKNILFSHSDWITFSEMPLDIPDDIFKPIGVIATLETE